MKSLNGLKLLLPLLIVAFAFISCDTDENPVGTLEEIAGRIPNVEVIPNADNATMHKRNDQQYSLFTVEVSGIGFNNNISDGTYFGWCADMSKPRRTGEDISNTNLFSTNKDERFNQLSYIVNNRPYYERQYTDLSWKDIQVAMWVVLETQDYELSLIESKLPSFVNGYSAENVNSIIDDLGDNGLDFKPGPGDKQLILMNAYDGSQPPLVEVCNTAWMKGQYKIADNNNANHWGMYEGYKIEADNVLTRDLVFKEGPVHNPTYIPIGVVRIETIVENNNGFIRVTITMDDNDLMVSDDVHVHIEDSKPDQAPGQFPFDFEFIESIDEPRKNLTMQIPFTGVNKSGDDYDLTPVRDVYVAVHMGACKYVEEE